jgi:predicted acyltransferase
VSLDAFRGLTIAAMILVNDPGSWEAIYPPLEHAPWHGWTPTDLVFPFFLFIVGVSIVLSHARRERGGAGRAALVRRIIVRAGVLVVIGLVLNLMSRPHLATVRFPGVLQRIGIVYLIAALLVVNTRPRTQGWITVVVLVGYWVLLATVPVPTLGAPSLDPGSNLPAWLDARVFGAHTWKPAFDPEGILSTAPAVATCLLGVATGRWLRGARPIGETVAGLFAGGTVLLAAGTIWDAWFPINKNLWTSSYVLFTAGAGLLLFGLLAWVIEVRGRRRWAWPLLVFGSNALLVFILSALVARLLDAIRVGGMTAQEWLYERLFASWAAERDASLLYAAATVVVWLGVMSVFYRRRWFVRL